MLIEAKNLGITQDKIDQVFLNWSDLLRFHSEFLASMNQNLSVRKPSSARQYVWLADAFLDFLPKVKHSYSRFTLGVTSSLETLDYLKKSKSKFVSWLSKTHEDPSLAKLKLNDYLLTPPKRIPIYALLLKTMLKFCSGADKDGSLHIEKALVLAQEIATESDKKKSQTDAVEKLKQIEKTLQLAKPLPGKVTTFLKEGTLYQISNNDHPMNTVYLFDNLFVGTHNNRSVVVFSLHKAIVEDIPDGDILHNRFQILLLSQQLIFFCASQEEKKSWMHAFKQTCASFTKIEKPEKTIIQGYLMKQTLNNLWQKRFSFVENGVLYYMKSTKVVSFFLKP
jgi:hypothetical protein